MDEITLPPGRLGVPEDEFLAMLDHGTRLFYADQTQRYTTAVTATLYWVVGLNDVDPLTSTHRPATPDAQLHLRVSAAAVVTGTPDPVFDRTGKTDPEWARGVEAALQWVKGPRDSGIVPPPPLTLPARETMEPTRPAERWTR